jgi:uncharacterized protein (DUF433 family)
VRTYVRPGRTRTPWLQEAEFGRRILDTSKTKDSPLKLNPLAEADPRLSTALFTFREAGAYLDVPTSTLQYWSRRTRRGESLVTAFTGEHAVPALSFVSLAEAYVLSVFRQAKVPMQRIRPALEKLKADLGVDYALASGHLYTDGRDVLFDYAFQAGDEVRRQLTEVRNGQTVLRQVIQSDLKRITWDNDRWPTRLRLPGFAVADVIVDIRRAYGRPIVLSGDARVEDVVGRFFGGDPIDEVAHDFGLSPEEVEDTIRVSYRAKAA